MLKCYINDIIIKNILIEGDNLNKNILVIDDDIDLCNLIKKYLELENYCVCVKHNGIDGLTEALSQNYELIVLDMMLPQKNGLDILEEIRQKSNVPVLILTAKCDEVDKVLGLRLGADDYLTKPFSMNEFLARTASLIRRFTALGSQNNTSAHDNSEITLEFEGLSIFLNTRTVIANNTTAELTAKEFELLFFLASNPGRVFTKKQIYTQVWEDEYAFDDNNIMVHIRRLRKKIEPSPDTPKYILTVWGVGYKFGGTK